MDLVFIELTEAFDTIDHDILCKSYSILLFSSGSSCGLNPPLPIENNFLESVALTP